MKITQQVRAAAGAEQLLRELARGGEPFGAYPPSQGEAEAGMRQMSKRFNDEGGEVYVPKAE